METGTRTKSTGPLKRLRARLLSRGGDATTKTVAFVSSRREHLFKQHLFELTLAEWASLWIWRGRYGLGRWHLSTLIRVPGLCTPRDVHLKCLHRDYSNCVRLLSRSAFGGLGIC